MLQVREDTLVRLLRVAAAAEKVVAAWEAGEPETPESERMIQLRDALRSEP